MLKHVLLVLLAVPIVLNAGFAHNALADSAKGKRLGLGEAIRIALENNFGILAADEAVKGAEHNRKSALADFFPKLSATGSYSYLSETPSITQSARPPIPVFINPGNPVIVADPTQPIGFIPGSPEATVEIGKREAWQIAGQATQPIFTGGALVNKYSLAKIGQQSAKTARERIERDLSLEVVRAYFDVLNAMEQKKVADKAVELLESQRNVAQEFFNVGMIPKNDLLKTEVQLAERIRAQTSAQNAVELAKARFNLVLQRPVNAPVELENIMTYRTLPEGLSLDQAIELAQRKRLEIQEAELRVKASEKQIRLAQSAYLPKINLTYTYFKTEGRSYSALSEGWILEAAGSWTFWEWGKKVHDVASAKSQAQRNRYALMGLKDQIALEVKDAYLSLRTAERNIFVAKKAVEQGKENFRMNQERYKEQVGTITEVLDAETLLSKAEADYYNALRTHNVAKAALRRAVGLPVYAGESSTP